MRVAPRLVLDQARQMSRLSYQLSQYGAQPGGLNFMSSTVSHWSCLTLIGWSFSSSFPGLKQSTAAWSTLQCSHDFGSCWFDRSMAVVDRFERGAGECCGCGSAGHPSGSGSSCSCRVRDAAGTTNGRLCGLMTREKWTLNAVGASGFAFKVSSYKELGLRQRTFVSKMNVWG